MKTEKATESLEINAEKIGQHGLNKRGMLTDCSITVIVSVFI